MSAAEFKRVEDAAVDEALALQEGAGLDVALEGFDRLGGWAIPFRDEAGETVVFRRPVVVERLRWRRSMCTEEFVYARARARRPVKVTLISAQQAAAYWDPDRSAAASGGFEPLRHVPDDRVVVLGLVTTKRPQLETVEELERRIAEAAAFVPLERLAVSPQCGFASTLEGNRLIADDQRRKLEVVAATARAVWG